MQDALVARGEDSVLLYLRRQSGEVLSGDLSIHLGLTSGRVANILRVLEHKKLVRRTQGDKDRRQVHVCLTEAGRREAGECWANLLENHRAMLEYLGDDAEEAVRIFGRLIKYYSKEK